MEYETILLAAGNGKRMQQGRNKMWLELGDKPLFLHSLALFLADKRCKKIVLVCQQEEQEAVRVLVESETTAAEKARIFITAGGTERQWSVKCGLKQCSQKRPILIHDGARPFADQVLLDRLLLALKESEAAVCGVPVKDTIKRVQHHTIIDTPDREELWQVQTPQAFWPDVINMAHEAATRADYLGTDDASLVEFIGKAVAMVEGDYRNIKLTTPEDMLIAQAILKARSVKER